MGPRLTETTLERLFARGRERAAAARRGASSGWSRQAGRVGFLLVAPRQWPCLSPRPARSTAEPLIFLIGAYVIACRAKFDIADGYTVPTELVLVPMLFLLPTPVVPLVVSVSWRAGPVIDYARGHTSVHRAFHVFGDCWHAVGPALVLVAGRRPGLLLGRAGRSTWSPCWPSSPSTSSPRLRALAWSTAPRRARSCDDRPGLRARRRPGADRTARDVRGDRSARRLPAGRSRWPGCSRCSRGERQTRIDQALELSEAYQGTALLLGDVVEADDAYTGSHSRGVVELSLAVADRLGLDCAPRRNVEFAALLHDVGKIAVPKEIINKPGPLDDGRVGGDEAAHGRGRADARPRRRRARRGRADRPLLATSTGTAAATPTGSPATDSGRGPHRLLLRRLQRDDDDALLPRGDVTRVGARRAPPLRGHPVRPRRWSGC